MRWITLGAIAATLGVLLARGVERGPVRLSRTAAPLFASFRQPSDQAPHPAAEERAPSGKPKLGEPLVAEEPPRRVEDTDPAELARAGTWRKTLQHYARWGNVEEQVPAAKAHLRRALTLAENPVARQNVIFLAAHTLPLEDARAVLMPLLGTGSAGDVEDVVCALAAAKDPEMFKRFEELAQSPSPANVRQLIDSLFEVELLASEASEEARSILRSYRMFELLELSGYYFRLAGAGIDVSFPRRRSAHRRAFRLELLNGWLARYPGHPGSDEVAILIAERHKHDGDEIEAARWYDRAACLPDQRRTSMALRRLLYFAERVLPRRDLDVLLRGELHNPLLLHYVAIRRTAAEESCAAGLARLAQVAELNPGTVLAQAWRNRDADLPRGLSGGPQKLGSVHDRIAGGRTDHDRLFPPREALPLSGVALARQFGLWERMAELERKRAAARGEEAASLLLGIGQLTLAEPDLFFPVYARHTFESGEFLDISRRRPEPRWHPWLRSTVHAARAIGVFRALEEEYPSYSRIGEARRGIESARVALSTFEPLDPRPRGGGATE